MRHSVVHVAGGQRHVIHYALAGIGSDVLQPAHVNVLKQLVGVKIRLVGVGCAVKANHDAIKRYLPGDLCTDTGLKIAVGRPGIKLWVRNKGIVVHLFALVLTRLHIDHVIRVTAFDAVITAIRARNWPGGVREDFFAFLVGHADHVNSFRKFGTFL